MTYATADHHGSNLTTEEIDWPAFNHHGEYCGHIYSQKAWAVPAGIHEEMDLPNYIDLYVTDNGQWAPTIEIAEHFLSTQSPPTDFVVKGASLGLFLPDEWVALNNIKIYADYRVFRNSFGNWDAEKLGALE
jgi:hypothetical protein